jgi:hypothetical protein
MSASLVYTSKPVTVIVERPELVFVRNLAQLLDAAFVIPGTNARIGLLAILGFIPVIGDMIGSAISSYILLVASRLGVPKVVIGRMMVNLGVDAVIGIVPVIGGFLESMWKANIRNVALIEEALVNPRAARRKSYWILLAVSSLLLVLISLLVACVWLLIAWIRQPQ